MFGRLSTRRRACAPLVAIAMSCALAGTVRADRAEDLLDALRESELVYSRTGNGAYLVVFDAEQATDVTTWPVVVTTAGAGGWVLVYATLIDEETEEAFGERILRRAMAYNSTTAGSKMALDTERGDLDVQVEIPFHALDGRYLREMVHDVAATCDRRHDEFRELLTAP